jgi:predicted O-methyltransferase YrrM
MSSRPEPGAERVTNFLGRYASALAYVAVTFSVGLMSGHRRALISRLARQAGYQESPRAALPTVEVDALTDAQTAVVLPFPEERDGSVSLLELTTLARLVRERNPSKVFEIGTFDGRTTAALAANASAGATVWTLDLPPGQATRFEVAAGDRVFIEKPVSGALLRGQPYEDRVRQLYGDSAAFDFTPYRADFVFVDGSHAYDYVRSDSIRALDLLGAAAGTIVWHDYGEWSGVTRALNELHSTDSRFAGLRHVRGTTLAILQR